MIRDIDAMVNEIAGTEASISREELGKIMCKPLKTKRPKRSKKELSKAHKRHLEEVERRRKEKEEARKLLRRKIAEVRATIEAERAGGLA